MSLLGAVATLTDTASTPPRSAEQPGTVWLVLDVSLSMQTADVTAPSSRLQLGRQFLLAGLPAKEEAASPLAGRAVGLILFRGDARMAAAPTREFAALARRLDAATPAAAAPGGSDLDSVLTLLAEVGTAEGDQAVLVTDGAGLGERNGESNGLLPTLPAVIPRLHVRGVGSPRDASPTPGIPARSTRLTEGPLHRLARSTGGSYRRVLRPEEGRGAWGIDAPATAEPTVSVVPTVGWWLLLTGCLGAFVDARWAKEATSCLEGGDARDPFAPGLGPLAHVPR